MSQASDEASMVKEILDYYAFQTELSKALGLPFQTRRKRLIKQMERKGLVKPITVTMAGFPPCIVQGWELV